MEKSGCDALDGNEWSVLHAEATCEIFVPAQGIWDGNEAGRVSAVGEGLDLGADLLIPLASGVIAIENKNAHLASFPEGVTQKAMPPSRKLCLEQAG